MMVYIDDDDDLAELIGEWNKQVICGRAVKSLGCDVRDSLSPRGYILPSKKLIREVLTIGA